MEILTFGQEEANEEALTRLTSAKELRFRRKVTVGSAALRWTSRDKRRGGIDLKKDQVHHLRSGIASSPIKWPPPRPIIHCLVANEGGWGWGCPTAGKGRLSEFLERNAHNGGIYVPPGNSDAILQIRCKNLPRKKIAFEEISK